MIIDCGSCTVRGVACTDCVVTFLTIPVRAGAGDAIEPGTSVEPVYGAGAPRAYPPDLDDAERRAIDVLARSGLVPPLRLVRAV